MQKRRSHTANENEIIRPKEDEEGDEEYEDDEEEGEVEAYEDLEVIVQGAYHKNESETVNGQTADAKRPSNSVKEDAHFLSHHNINNGFSEAIEILRKSGSLNQGVPHKGSNGCCRDNIQMISQVWQLKGVWKKQYFRRRAKRKISNSHK